MGDEQGLRLALQASRAGSVTPVLHQIFDQVAMRDGAAPAQYAHVADAGFEPVIRKRS
jgi:hypothetical protein